MSRPAAGASPDWDESVTDGRFLNGSSLGAESQGPDIPLGDQTVRLSPADESRKIFDGLGVVGTPEVPSPSVAEQRA